MHDTDRTMGRTNMEFGFQGEGNMNEFYAEMENGEFQGEQPLLHEEELNEMAAELLSVTNDRELEQFLGDVFKKVGSAVGSFVRSGNSENALHAYNNLGIASAELHEWLEADVYFSRGIEIAERLSHTPLLAKLYGNRAEPLIEIGDFDHAEQMLDGAERAATAVGDRVASGVVWRWRAACRCA